MRRTIENVLVRDDPPAEAAVPVVFDSPHSGAIYPSDFGHACPIRRLREAEDTAVDELIASAPAHGAALLCALFPRSYIDVNRALADLDESLLDAPWPGAVTGGDDRSLFGAGLIRKLCRPGLPMYDRLLSVAEVRNRIERYYVPYHDALTDMLDAAWARHGRVWYVDCHSMPSIASADDPGRERADFVLGDRDGTTCDPAFTAFVADTLRGLGYGVRVNMPYKGVELIRRHGRPGEGRHALQIEISRRLYLDERTLERSAGFPVLRAAMDRLIGAICAYARDAIAAQPPGAPAAALTGRSVPTA